ncbi:GlxA family transcriptional regulator [Rhizobium lusitanum]|uniref:Transcriptional regulator GlxA family with amidase domain n=1 Tax=Rhizobium lusitanum TaxID=293958 RepID=A0A7X0ISK0_9HYPH|nr:helix-turn-helix domain-containing protein [Rhizobium lusitanum]MBB6486044.1 transcriptional regulator GlxA family with amidase domain [Rhizobium lusitanum]
MIIRIWVYDGILASGVSAPVDVFMAANHFAAKQQARSAARDVQLTWRVESLDGLPIRTASGQLIEVDGRIGARKPADAVIVTAPFVGELDSFIMHRDRLAALSSALRHLHEKGSYIASYCTGAYLLAEAGLLDGRMATTHWSRADDFARRYPRVTLRAQEFLTEQDRIICGGAVTSFLVLAMRLVELFLGSQLATITAKAMLIDTNRISQMSYANLVLEHDHGDRLVAQAQQQMEAALAKEFRLSELAARLAVSERTLHRRFLQAVGQPPLSYLQTLRIEVAKRLLETSDINFETVSQNVGYTDFGTFRDLFKRKTGLSPRDYRRQFTKVPVRPGAHQDAGGLG